MVNIIEKKLDIEDEAKKKFDITENPCIKPKIQGGGVISLILLLKI